MFLSPLWDARFISDSLNYENLNSEINPILPPLHQILRVAFSRLFPSWIKRPLHFNRTSRIPEKRHPVARLQTCHLSKPPVKRIEHGWRQAVLPDSPVSQAHALKQAGESGINAWRIRDFWLRLMMAPTGHQVPVWTWHHEVTTVDHLGAGRITRTRFGAVEDWVVRIWIKIRVRPWPHLQFHIRPRSSRMNDSHGEGNGTCWRALSSPAVKANPRIFLAGAASST